MKEINTYITEKFKITKNSSDKNREKLLSILKDNEGKYFQYTELENKEEQKESHDWYLDKIDTISEKDYQNHPIFFYVVEKMKRKIKCKLAKPIYITKEGILYDVKPENIKIEDLYIAPGEILDIPVDLSSRTVGRYRPQQFWVDSYYGLVTARNRKKHNPYDIIYFGESEYSYHRKYWNDITMLDDKSTGVSKIYNELGLL